MHFRLTFLLAGIFSLIIPAKTLALDNCDSSNKDTGIEANMVSGGLQLISTQKIKVESDLKEDFIKSLFKAESFARIELLKWIKSNCNNRECFNLEKLIDSTNLDGQLSMMVTNSKCHIRRKYVQVSVELSSKTMN